jgi:hypothetical protein
MLNEFKHNPLKVNILGVDHESLYLKETLVFVGDVPDNIYKELVSVSKSNKKSPLLKKFYGTDWKNKIGLKSKENTALILGGEEEPDLGDELDQLDLFDIGDEVKEPPVVRDEYIDEDPDIPSKPATKKGAPQKPIVREDASIKFIRDVSLFPEDKVSEFKTKIYLAGGPAPYKQHIFYIMRNTTIPLWYTIMGETGNVPVDLRDPSKDTILDIPIDREFYEMRESVKIFAGDEFQTLNDIYSNHGVVNYYLVSVDDYFVNRRGEVEELARSDRYQMNLLYYSFIMKYWPMITLDVFKTYLTNEQEMSDVYPDLKPSTGKIQSIYDDEKDQLNAKYELLADAHAGYKKHPRFKKYNPEFVLKLGKSRPSALISVSIKNATLSVDTKHSQGLGGQIKLNVRNLFDSMEVSEDIPLIKIKLMRGRNPYILTKTKKKNVAYGENIQAIFEQIKYQIQLPYYNTILFAVRAHRNGKYIRASQEVSKYIIFVLYDNGKCLIRSVWNEDEKMDFQKIQQILEGSTKKLIDTINGMGRMVFASAERLPYISSGNSEFTELSTSIFWKKTIALAHFNQIIDELKKKSKSGIIVEHEGDAAHEYVLKKGVTGYDLQQLDKYVAVTNYYAYLSDATVKQKWLALFDQGRLLTISHRTTDVKLEVQGIKENEFKYFYHYIISFLFQSESLLRGKGKQSDEPTVKLGTKINTLKLLKARDPEAFIFKKFGSDVVYSRICQKDHQPIPFSPDEVKMLPAEDEKRAVKFWNYTTESDMYYLCRRGKFPYLNFITGQHPKNYCLACCKKTPAYTLAVGRGNKPRNKKERIYQQCVENHEYTEQEEESGASRYVMIYGKDLYVGRIGKLPDTIQQYLLYNLENVDILSEYTVARTFTMNNNKYSVDRLFKITKNIKVHKVAVNDLLDHLKRKSWEYKREGVADIMPIEVIDTPKKNRKFAKHYNRIITADISYPILVYDADDFSVIVDGLHRLSRAYIEKHPTIKVRYVTDKQLEKVLISEMSTDDEKTIGVSKDAPVSTVRRNKKTKAVPKKKGKFETVCDTCGEMAVTGGAFDEKKPGYYIYGVPQSNKNITNIGVLYSLAIALNMEFTQLINFTIKILKDNPQYFSLLLNGELSRYFENNNDLVDIMCKLFKGNKALVTPFSRWNDLFIDIARICYDKTVIIFDDTSIITTGTSMKVSVVDDINLILPQQVTYLEDIIPPIDDDADHRSYILLLQRRKKSKSAFEKSSKVYYPIFIFVPYVFFKSQQIEKRIYTQNDEIMKLVRNMVQSALDEKYSGSITREQIDFRTIYEFLEGTAVTRGTPDYAIDRLYINSKDMCYAVILGSSKGLIYVPIVFSYFSGAERFFPKNKTDEDVLEYDVFDRKGKFTPEALKDFVENYNKFVVKKSKEAGMLRTVVESDEYKTKEEASVIPIYPLIRMSKVLVLSDRPGYKNGKKFSIIGLTSGELNYYISDATGISKFIKTMSSGYNVFTFNPKKMDDSNFQYLYYDPFMINNLIINKEKSIVDRRQKLLAQAFYNKYLYRLFTIELIRYFDKDRNEPTRKKIKTLVTKSNFKNMDVLDTVRDKIGLMLEDFPNDTARLQEQVSIFYNTHFDKKLLIEDINTSVYEFDRLTLSKVVSEGKDHWSLTAPDQLQQRNKMVEKLKSIAKNFISIGKPKIPENMQHMNILSACKDTNAPYCAGKKLIMTAEKFEQYVSLFADDLLNPMKNPYILALIYAGNIVDEFQFERRPGEDIYIKF